MTVTGTKCIFVFSKHIILFIYLTARQQVQPLPRGTHTNTVEHK